MGDSALEIDAVPMRRYILNALLHWLPVTLWMAWIFWLSDQPKLPHPARRLGLSDYLFDYAAHAFTFGLLAALAWWAFVPLKARRLLLSLSPPLLSGLFSALYAISDELHQAFVPGRWAKVSDWLADMVGILLTLSFISWIGRSQLLRHVRVFFELDRN